jgi:hypothetical protein
VVPDPNSDLYPPPGALNDAGEWEQAVGGRALTAVALTLAAVTTLIPLIPGAIGMVVASRAKKKGDPLAHMAFVLNGIAIAVGLVVGALLSTLDVQTSALPIWWMG